MIRKYQKPPVIAGINFSDKEIENARKSRKLLSISLLTSNKCNLHCLYCYRDAGSKLSEELDFDEQKKILIQAKRLGAKVVWIPGSGEPLCDKIFYDKEEFPLIDFANGIGLYVIFFTNGSLITEKVAGTLFPKKVSVITKLNSFSKTTQDLLSGKNSFEKIWQGLQNLINAGFNEGNRLGIDSVIVKQNYQEISELFCFCRDNHAIPYITTELHGGRGTANAEFLDVDVDAIKQIFLELLVIDQKRYGYTWFPSPPLVAGHCKKLLHDIVVDSVGNIQICPGINISLGNVRQMSIKSVLESNEIVAKFRNPKEYLKGKCGKCLNRDCVYGCRLSAFASGDLFGEDPQCWHSRR